MFRSLKKEAEFGVLSTLHLDLSMKEWEAETKRLQLLVIPGSHDDDEEELRYLAFLPPRYHLLMKVCRGNEGGRGVGVWLATDYWRNLGHLSDYLATVSAGTEVLGGVA